MGFTERVMHIADYDRDRRPARSGYETPSLAYRSAEGRSHAERGSPRLDFEAGHPRHVPETWPALLSRDQLCAYVGVAATTITKVCPIRPLDMGANVVRYSRVQIDEWVATLPPRLMVAEKQTGDIGGSTGAAVSAAAEPDVAESRVEAALDRVRARAGGTKWRKTA